MAKLNIAPTKSNLISVKSQLSFAQDGFDLLEQKRQILVYELMSRLGRAKDIEKRIAKATKPAYASLHGATLAIGAAGLGFWGNACHRGRRPPGDQQHHPGSGAVSGEEYLFAAAVAGVVGPALCLSLRAHSADADLHPDGGLPVSYTHLTLPTSDLV